MRRPWRRVRPEERDLVVASFSTLGALMTAHVVLETARDALFLSTISSRLLPWTYVLIAALILVSTMAMTALDFVFKDQMAARFPPEQLGLAFALIYLGLNLLSLVVQLFLTGPLLQRVGVVLALSALPLVVSAGGIIGLAGWLFGGAVLGKVGDGAFRHTLDRTGRELLYLPMERTLRDRVKPVIDILGHRGGQALASILLLLLLALQLPPVALLVGLCGLWLALGLTLKRRYVRLFRDTLRQSVVDIQPDFPELDLASLDSLVTRLGSENDDEVLASMAVLDRLGRDHLVSALILYHPSAAVVEAALDHFALRQRRDFIPIARRLLGHSTPRVHAAVVLALHAVDPDDDALKSELGAGCGCTRATAAVLLMDTQPELARIELQDWHCSGPVIRRAIARATRAGRGQASLKLLFEILKDTDWHVRKAALQSLSGRLSPDAVGPLLGLLSDIEHGAEVFGLLVSLGTRIADSVDAALANPDTDPDIRWRLPELLARLDPQGAPARLQVHLAGDIHSRVEARIILSLSQLHIDHPEIAAPSVSGILSGTLSGILSRTLDEVVELAYADQVLCSQPERSPLRSLLSTFLCDKRDSAKDAVLRLSCLSWRSGDARRILRGLRNPNPLVHASALELLEASLSGP
ncbi:MAG: hypothetical protein GXP62_14690, partial [Oligoflexia bacterium]|nr:hypothetical protein [Oligoflexia bacterium]